MTTLGDSKTTAVARVDSPRPVKAKVQYLTRDDQHRSVKPYYLYLDYDSDILPTNTSGDDQFVYIRDARDLDMPSMEMFSKWGFTKVQLKCALTPEDYWSDKKVEETLYPKYKEAAQLLFPDAVRVEVLEHNVRKRHPRWMAEKLERHHLKTNQPSDYVHIDMTASSARKCAIKQFNIYPKDYARFVVVNFWKPIKGPVYDYPLTLCDRRTVNYATHTTAMDIITFNSLNENTRVYFDEKHQWYYWHGLQVDEVIAFVQADSNTENSAGVPHTAFRDPRGGDGIQLRESIEARVFVYFN